MVCEYDDAWVGEADKVRHRCAALSPDANTYDRTGLLSSIRENWFCHAFRDGPAELVIW